MSLQAGEEGRLDFVLDARCLRTEASFDVVSEAPAVSVVPGHGGGGELVAGLEQEVRLALTTGSHHIQEVRYTISFFLSRFSRLSMNIFLHILTLLPWPLCSST